MSKHSEIQAPRISPSSGLRSRARLPLLAAAVLAVVSLLAVATAQAIAPTVTIQNASPEYTTAHLAGTVNPQGKATTWSFQYITEAAYQQNLTEAKSPFQGAATGPEGSIPANYPNMNVSGDLTGLAVETTYHLRLLATNEDGTEEAIAASTFTTKPPAAPLIDKTFPSGVGTTEATLEALIDPRGAATTYRFQYTTQAHFEAEGFTGAAETTPAALEGKADPDDTAAAPVSGLQPATKYRFRALAENAQGTATGPDAWLRTYAPSEAPETCPNAARREEEHATFLPDCRAYELVSPAEKNGGEVMAMSSRTHAAEGESPGLPAAVAFGSLQAFGDASGTGIATEYLSQRDAAAGGGWSTHAVTPQQDPTSLLGLLSGLEPNYESMSADLTKGVFWASTPLTDSPNVEHVPNLYRREDLRTPGAGSYTLLSGSSSPLPPVTFGTDVREFVADTSSDYNHVLFESRQNLTPDASGANVKLYKSDGGAPRLVSVEPACPGASGARAEAPCSAAPQGTLSFHYAQRTLSGGGSRAIFASPVSSDSSALQTNGAASKLFQLEDRGTATTADDATIQLDASEATTPGSTRAAIFGTASADGNRVFFFSSEKLLDSATGGGLYMWQRAETNERQTLTVNATGGSFTLTAHSQPSHGTGTLTAGSSTVEGVEGAFEVGQTVSGAGIPTGTTIAAIPSATSLTLSAPAGAGGHATLSASMASTTTALPFNASAQQVQEALEGLANVGEGNVAVSGGPGGAGGATPYAVTFTGALAGVDVMPLTAGAGGLSGGTASATVAVSVPVRNLTRIAPIPSLDLAGTLGASADGHRLYFASAGAQLVVGAPPVQQSAIYYWQDAEGPPGGTLSYVGGIASGDMRTNIGRSLWIGAPKTARVSPDGRYLVFEVSDGSALAPGYDQSRCLNGVIGNPNSTGNGCSEVYVYKAEGATPTKPDLRCASCNPTGTPASANAWLDLTAGASATAFTAHLSHALSDDGRYVFFSTAEALVPRDTNGTFDAYEYDTQSEEAHLLSSGTEAEPSYFLDASADGRDVYFATRQPLLGWDKDHAYDLYDVRVQGGLPEPPPAPPVCAGEACKGASPPAPPPPPLGSGREGHGNPPIHRRCPKGKVRRHGRCVARHHHRRHHRRAAR